MSKPTFVPIHLVDVEICHSIGEIVDLLVELEEESGDYFIKWTSSGGP